MPDYTTNLPPNTNFLNFAFLQHISIGPNLLWGMLVLLTAIMGGTTLVLYYHWFRYGFGDRTILFAQVLYSLIVLAGFVVMISSLLSYAA